MGELGNDRRLARSDATGRKTYFSFLPGGEVIGEYERTGDPASPWRSVREYVWLESKPIAQEEHPSGSERYTYAIHCDHIGLPRALTNSAGQGVWFAHATPYGDLEEVTSTDSVSGRTVVTNLRLPGQYDERLLGSLGLQGPYYNWNRWYLPSVGRYLELDPIAKAGGFNGFYGPNWYGYAEGNPLRRTDPLGLFVTGVYDCKTGRLTMMDTDTGATASMDAESGGKPFGDPIPDGMWEILEQARRADFYRLDAWDANPRDDVHDPTGRDHLRLHKPGNTVGCIAAKDKAGWDQVKNLIDNTRTDSVPDMASPWWKFWSTPAPIKRYGNIFAVNCGS